MKCLAICVISVLRIESSLVFLCAALAVLYVLTVIAPISVSCREVVLDGIADANGVSFAIASYGYPSEVAHFWCS